MALGLKSIKFTASSKVSEIVLALTSSSKLMRFGGMLSSSNSPAAVAFAANSAVARLPDISMTAVGV